MYTHISTGVILHVKHQSCTHWKRLRENTWLCLAFVKIIDSEDPVLENLPSYLFIFELFTEVIHEHASTDICVSLPGYMQSVRFSFYKGTILGFYIEDRWYLVTFFVCNTEWTCSVFQ